MNWDVGRKELLLETRRMHHQTYCFSLSKLHREGVDQVGGKASNLAVLLQAGLPSPSGFVISTDAYQNLLEASNLNQKIQDLLANVDCNNFNQTNDAENIIRALFQETGIPGDLKKELLNNYRLLGNNTPVAVRSSATTEDTLISSSAGQYDSFLNVRGDDALLDTVQKCWSSLYTSRALFYRQKLGIKSIGSMAVIVQSMICSEKSGVLFTSNPMGGNHNQMMIEAVWGLGEGAVSGTITPDQYIVEAKSGIVINSFVPAKKAMVYCDSNGGTKTRDVSSNKILSQVLSQREIQELVSIGAMAIGCFGCHQDIEWCYKGNQVYVLQSRPITVMQ